MGGMKRIRWEGKYLRGNKTAEYLRSIGEELCTELMWMDYWRKKQKRTKKLKKKKIKKKFCEELIAHFSWYDTARIENI